MDRDCGTAIVVHAGVSRFTNAMVMAMPGVSAARRMILTRRMRVPQPGRRAGQQPGGDQRASGHAMECLRKHSLADQGRRR